MKELLVLLAHLLTTLAKLLGPGGAKAIVTDSLLMKQQLLIIHRCHGPANLYAPQSSRQPLNSLELLYPAT